VISVQRQYIFSASFFLDTTVIMARHQNTALKRPVLTTVQKLARREKAEKLTKDLDGAHDLIQQTISTIADNNGRYCCTNSSRRDEIKLYTFQVEGVGNEATLYFFFHEKTQSKRMEWFCEG
jgi:hypothetical protein